MLLSLPFEKAESVPGFKIRVKKQSERWLFQDDHGGCCACVCVAGGVLSRNLILPLEILRPFELWYWRRLLRVPWTARKSNQSILKEINPEYSLEGLMLKLKLQLFGHLMQRTDLWKRPWCWEKLRTRGEAWGRGWDEAASLIQWTWVWINSGRWSRTRKIDLLQFMRLQRVGHDLVTE